MYCHNQQVYHSCHTLKIPNIVAIVRSYLQKPTNLYRLHGNIRAHDLLIKAMMFSLYVCTIWIFFGVIEVCFGETIGTHQLISFFAADACPDVGKSIPTTLQDRSHHNDVLCCDISGKECYKPDVPCQDQWTHEEANDICASMGKRLCTLNETSSGICCNKGCNRNSKSIWTNDSHTGELLFQI